MAELTILGIDPGLNITGYGIIRIAEDNKPRLFTYGHIHTNANKKLSERLYKIHQELSLVIEKYAPDEIAIENIFYAENVKTAIIMGHARGAAIIAAMKHGVDVDEYSPREVKMSVVGTGGAVKSQVNFMVRNLLQIRDQIEPDDASDALAVAICHWHRVKNKKLQKS